MSGLQLPGELSTLLRILGIEWPQADETKLFELGQVFNQFSSTLKEIGTNADQVASGVWSQNQGQDIQAFQNSWSHSDGPAKVLGDSSQALTLMGTGMSIFGAIMLALKIQKIVQLTILAIQIAQAIAMAVPTFGASLAEIPIFQQITQRIINELINQVLAKLMSA
jgi:hypothetical protein